MKKRHSFRRILVFCILLSLVLICCDADDSQPKFHSFRHDYEHVVKIELCSYDHYKRTSTWKGAFVTEDCFTPLFQLSEEDAASFWQDVLSLEITKFYMFDPILDYGDIVILMHYDNNEMEMIGITNIGWISHDGELTTTDKKFDISEICDVIAKYVDADILRDASAYFSVPTME